MIRGVGRRLRCCALVCLILSSFAFVSCTGESNADLVTVDIGLHKTSLYTQESMPITAEVQWLEAANDRRVVYQWTVNEDVSELDDASTQSPRITGKAAGKAEISLSVDVLDANGKKVSSAHANKKVVDIVPRISPKSTGMQATDFVPKSVIDDFDDGVQWDSSNIEVAVIDSSTGVITPVQEGSTDITARNGVSEQLFSFRLDIAIPVQSVSLEPQSVRIQKGEKAIVKAVISPDNAKDREIYWTSPNSGLVRLSFDGEQVELEGAKVGSGQIGVMTHDGYFTSVSEIEVIDTIKVSRVDLDVPSLSMRLGQKATITASAYPQDALVKDILWKVSDPAVVSIDPKGNQCVVEVIELSQSGEPVVVTAYSPDGPEGKCEVNVVNVAVDAIEIEQEDTTLSKDGQKQLSAKLTPQDADDLSIVWKSSNPDVLNVDENGLVTVLRIPEEDESNPIIVTAIASSGVSDEMSILVEVPMTGIMIESEKSVMGIGKSQNLSVRFIPSNTTYDRTIEWSVGDDAVLGVSEDGRVLALSAGETSVSAECTASGFADSIDLAVVQVQSLSMTNGSITILHDGSANAEAVISVLPDKEAYKDVAFFSSDEEIATVDSVGHIVAKGAGDAEISAKNIYDDSVEATLSLTVVKVRSVELNRTAVSLKGDSPFTLTADVEASPDRSIYKAVRWVSEDEDLVKVEDLGDNSANITALGVTTSGPVVVKAISTKDSRVLDVCEVSTGISITGVEIVSEETSLESGDEIALLANVTTAPSTPGYGAVEWQISSQDSGIVSSSITQGGVLTAVGKGNVVVTATSAFDNIRIATKAISVGPKVSGITLSPSSATIRYGKTTSLTASVDVVPSNYGSVSWSYDSNYLSINSDGVVEAINVTPSGIPSVITARSSENDSFEATSSITVIPDVIMDAGSSSVSLEYGDNLQLSPSVVSSPSGYTALSWQSSDPNTVSVSSTGLLNASGVTSSPVTITATSQYDSDRQIEYSVSVAPKFTASNFTITADSDEMEADEELQLSIGSFVLPNIDPYNAVEWTSSNTDVATVDQNGLVSSLADGSCTITATPKYAGSGINSTSIDLTVSSGAPTDCIELRSSGSFSIKTYDLASGWEGDLWYSTDKGKNWVEWDGSEITSGLKGSTYSLRFKGKGNTRITNSTGFYQGHHWVFTASVKDIEARGNIMTLLDWDHPETATMASNCFAYMFSDCNALISAPELPATTLADNCYQYMFRSCPITVAPALPATTLADYCYSNMFAYTKIVSAPELPATSLKRYCYDGMFYGSTLAEAPELPAMAAAERCYYRMFNSCKDLTAAPALPATTLANNCYDSMFYYCTALAEAPALPATTLADNCYNSMFSYCSSLASAPALPATVLTNSCYRYMFRNCTSLVAAPDLPAVSLAQNCYNCMFKNCTSLVAAPDLPAVSLAQDCYNCMFESCSSLVSAPALPATELVTGCYGSMFKNCKALVVPPAVFAGDVPNFVCWYMLSGCSSLKVSDTQSEEYPYAFVRFNSYVGSGTHCEDMFTSTGGPFTSNPEAGVTYYTNHRPVIND